MYWSSIAPVKAMDDRQDDLMSGMQKAVERERMNLEHFAGRLPAPLRIALEQHFQERLERSERRPMFGEYAPFLLGSVLKAGGDVVDSLSFPWLLMYEHTLLLDDLVDQERPNRSSEMILCNLLLDVALDRFEAVLGRECPVWKPYRVYRDEWLRAMADEIACTSDRGVPSSESALLRQGRKAAIVKFCAVSILFLDKGRLLTSDEERGLDSACAAIQLLDDLADVSEDYLEGRTNLLLQDVSQWLESNIEERSDSPTPITEDSLVIGLAYSGAVVRLWFAAAKCMDSAVDSFPNACDHAIRYFRGLSDSCRSHAMLLDEEIKQLPDSHTEVLQGLLRQQNDLGGLADNPVLSRILGTISDRIHRGPKASQ